MSTGAVGHIGINKEQSWGVANTTSMYFAAGMSESIATDIDRYEYKEIHASITEQDDLRGLHNVQGTLVLPMFPQTTWHVIKGLMMTQSNYQVTAVDSLWTAIYTSPNGAYSAITPRPAHTIEIYRDVTSSHQYTGSIFTRADIKVEVNQPAIMGVNILGKQSNIASKSVPYYSNDLKPLAFDTCSISISGVGVDLLESFTLSIDNNMIAITALNNSNLIAGVAQSDTQTIRFNGVVDFANLTEYNKFVNQTEQSFSFSMKQIAPNISQIIVDMPRVLYTKFEPKMANRGRIMAEMEGFAKYHAGSATAIRITVYSQNDYGFLILGHPVYGILGSRTLWG